MELRVGLEREVIGRDVRRAERDRLAHVGERQRRRLLGKGVHEVGVHLREGLERAGERAARLVRAVHASDRLEACVVEALHAERQAIDSRLAVAAEARRLEGAGIGFERDLGIGIDPQARAQRRDEALDRLRREQARRAPADEDRVEAPPPDLRQARLEIGYESVHVARLGQVAAPFVRVEIAIRALAKAPRDMRVERERRKLGELDAREVGEGRVRLGHRGIIPREAASSGAMMAR